MDAQTRTDDCNCGGRVGLVTVRRLVVLTFISIAQYLISTLYCGAMLRVT
jgi:hypothetical protein